jgi:hypothetical protein
MIKNFILLSICLLSYFSFSQEKEIINQGQFWTGYMTSARISENYSLWNDFHYVPDGFFVARTGITRSFFEKLYLTAGYAYLNIPTESNDTKLNRTEHRPWMQTVANHELTERWTMINRVRYDMRYRQNFANGELLNDFNFNHRLRLLIGLRYHFEKQTIFSGTPYINLSNEVLINFGENIITNHFNQNRTWLTLGLRLENTSFQVGYMNRFVKLSQNQRFVRNHTLVVWISQRFDFRKKEILGDDDEHFYQIP